MARSARTTMKLFTRSLSMLLVGGLLTVGLAAPAMASGGGSGGGGSGGGADPGTGASCVRVTVNPPQIVGTGIRWTGSAANCSSGAERIVLKALDVSGSVTSGCVLPPFGYGLPSQAAGQTVWWFMTSKRQPCPGTHTEEFDAFVGSAPTPDATTTVTYTTS
jgi:hypothetical protein